MSKIPDIIGGIILFAVLLGCLVVPIKEKYNFCKASLRVQTSVQDSLVFAERNGCLLYVK